MTHAASGGGGALRPAVFLDRDGTVIVDRHYLGDPAGVELLPGAASAIRSLNRAHLPVVLVTNQSGIARGLFTEADFGAVQRRLAELLEAEGARLDAVYHCPHPPDASPRCGCRKPEPGLFLRAADELGLDLARSWWVGDRARDVGAAARFGGGAFLVRPGAGEETEGGGVESAGAPSATVVPSLRAAADAILRHHSPIDSVP